MRWIGGPSPSEVVTFILATPPQSNRIVELRFNNDQSTDRHEHASIAHHIASKLGKITHSIGRRPSF
jgi:hypothetical protein